MEAVHVGNLRITSVCSLLLQAWQHYQLSLAITEAHCTCEEQVRWLHYVWEEVRAAREQGADVSAVTVWSLFGAFDWDSLLTQNANSYETGVYDVHSGHV